MSRTSFELGRLLLALSLGLWTAACGDDQARPTSPAARVIAHGEKLGPDQVPLEPPSGVDGDWFQPYVPPISAPPNSPPSTIERLDLGPVAWDELAVFDVPEDTVGYTVLVTAPAPEHLLGIYSLAKVNGEPAISAYAVAGNSAEAFAELGWVAAAVPQSDAFLGEPVPAGPWELELWLDEAIDTAEVSIWFQRAPQGAFQGGVVDVHVYTAPDTVASSYIEQVIAEMFGQYLTTGIGLQRGNTEYTLIGSDRTIIDSVAEVDRLFASSNGASDTPTLNLFVVADFVGDELSGVLGYAGGIPGVPMIDGTSRSGVVFAPTGDLVMDSSVLAHEIGHLGGLFHTTQIGFDITDPLADTPSCAIETMLQDCPDVGNIMFPYALGLGAGSFSESQKQVLKSSMLYRPRGNGSTGSGNKKKIADAMAKPNYALTHHQHAPELRSATLTDPPSRLLGSAWCARSGDVGERVLELIDHDLTVIEQVVRDETASDVARMHALQLLARETLTATRRGEVAALAKNVARSAKSGLRLRTMATRMSRR